jgi:myo-inositol 2-dehydrogenase / D-chiro-inositol 1-dehydrogenase
MTGIAVLGYGRIGAMHAANIAAHPRARLAAVQDINGAAAVEAPRPLPGFCDGPRALALAEARLKAIVESRAVEVWEVA